MSEELKIHKAPEVTYEHQWPFISSVTAVSCSLQYWLDPVMWDLSCELVHYASLLYVTGQSYI